MSKFPSIPLKGTDKNSKLFLDMLAGRMGFNNTVVTMGDLYNMGFVGIAGGLRPDQLPPGVNPGDVIKPITPGDGDSVDVENPTTPKQLTTAGSWGAIFLAWDFPAYSGHYATEIWRNNENDLSTASLVATATGRTYTDYVGEKIGKYYWVRNRNIADTVGGYNGSTGIYGESNLVTTAEDFVLANPEAEYVPFTIVNYGDDANPDWKMLLNGQVIITSDLSIGQLITGEMRPNTRFTIGNGSIELGTDTNGLGFMQVSGDGGIVGNDYLYLNAGELNMYVYDPNQGQHVKYKQLRRIERGTANSGSEVIIPPYFKAEPYVQLSISNISSYNANFPDQSQMIQVNTGAITPVDGVLGSYKFTPIAELYLADGVVSDVKNYDSGTLTNVDTWVKEDTKTYLNAKQFQVTFDVRSQKRATADSWQNRQVTIEIQGKLNGAAYTTLVTQVVELTGDNTPILVNIDTGVLTQGDWQLQFVFTAGDRSGTTPAPGQDYDYYEDLNVTAGDEFTLVNDADDVAGNEYSQLIQSHRPNPGSGWNLYAIDFKVNYNRQVEAWQICYADCNEVLPKNSRGTATGIVPGKTNLSVTGNNATGGYNTPLCNQYLSSSDKTYKTSSDSGVAGTGGKINITENSEPYISGRYSNELAKAQGGSAQSTSISTCFYGTAKTTLTISGYDVSYYYRKPKPQDFNTYNRFIVETVSADLGATAIPVGNATLNWIAVGE